MAAAARITKRLASILASNLICAVSLTTYNSEQEKGMNTMKSINIMEQWNNYKTTTAATVYLFGFVLDGNLYMVYIPTDNLPDWIVRHDVDSRDGADKLRVNLDKWNKAKLRNNFPAVKLGRADELLEGKNKGVAFEQLIYKRNRKEWKKDDTAYYEKGDINIAGNEVQIKYESASFARFDTIRKAMERKEMK